MLKYIDNKAFKSRTITKYTLGLKKFIKDFLFIRAGHFAFYSIFKPLSFYFFLQQTDYLDLTKQKKLLICDFYFPTRNYKKRFQLYQKSLDHYYLLHKKI